VQPSLFSISYGQQVIVYQLIYSRRKTLEIAVHPDCTVIVKAPTDADPDVICEKVLSRGRWILKQINYFKQFKPATPARCYVNGETHLYLGRQYRLKVVKGSENNVKLSRGFFHVTCCHEPTPEKTKKLLNAWYREKAQLQFTESMERCWRKFEHLDLAKPKLSTARMLKRWGSISNLGTITLNTELIKVPKECIDYVITHELCHLKHHNHGPDFYKLLSSVLPDWEKLKNKLELNVI
jgi:predicted metal-dependent hydrolase